jgi:hypothetical protein
MASAMAVTGALLRRRGEVCESETQLVRALFKVKIFSVRASFGEDPLSFM